MNQDWNNQNQNWGQQDNGFGGNNFGTQPAPKKSAAPLIGVAVVGIAVIALVIFLISSLFGGGYKKAIDNMFDASMFGKESAIKNLLPKDVWNHLEDEYDEEMDDVIDEMKESAEDSLESLEDEYGKNIKVSFKVTDKDNVDKDDLDDMKKALKNVGVNKKDVKKALEVEIEATIKGKDDKDEDEMELTLVKIGSKWYVYELVLAAGSGYGF